MDGGNEPKRPKTGGRKAGTPNRATLEQADTAPGGYRMRMVPAASLEPYENNARTHSDAQIEQICASIREFGWTNPILTDGRRGVIAGHGRLLAALKMGTVLVPVVELRHLTALQRRAYVIADNKLALNAGWDVDALAGELLGLKDGGFDLSLTGFDDGEIGRLLGPDDGLAEPAPTPEPAPITCPACGHVFHAPPPSDVAAERAPA